MYIVYVHKRFLWVIIDELSSFDSVSWKLFQAKTTKDYVTQGAFCALWPPKKKASLFFHEGNGQVHSQLLKSTGFLVMFRDSWWRSSGEPLAIYRTLKILGTNSQPQLVHDFSSQKMYNLGRMERNGIWSNMQCFWGRGIIQQFDNDNANDWSDAVLAMGTK